MSLAVYGLLMHHSVYRKVYNGLYNRSRARHRQLQQAVKLSYCYYMVLNDINIEIIQSFTVERLYCTNYYTLTMFFTINYWQTKVQY